MASLTQPPTRNAWKPDLCSRYSTFNALLEISFRETLWAGRGMILGALGLEFPLFFKCLPPGFIVCARMIAVSLQQHS